MIIEPKRRGIDHCYRAFACWAARRAEGTRAKTGGWQVVAVVERYLRGEIEFEEVRAARARATGGVTGAGVCGLPHYMPGAAIQIADFHTTNESAPEAARLAMYFAARAAGFKLFEEAFAVIGHDTYAPGYAVARHEFARQHPHIMLAAEATERAILTGELKSWLNQCCAGLHDEQR
jgi:hypothetical protein